MRVLHVIPSVSARRGGPSAVIFPMVAALRARGIEAEIATSDEDTGTPKQQFLEQPEHRGVPVRYFPRWGASLQVLRDYAFSPCFAAWLGRNITGYDLLHVHALFSHLPTVAMSGARRQGVPYLNRPLGQLGRWPLLQSPLRKKLYLRLIEAQNLRDAEALHFTSESERDEAAALRSAAGGVVIPHGIELPALLPHAREALRIKLNLPPDQKLALFLGRLHPKKGLDWLVRALGQMTSPRPLLLIAGEGGERGEIERLADRLGIAHNLRWLGHVEGEWKQLCLQGVDLFALTSHHENFGVAVLEALAAGTPVLVSDQVALAGDIARHGLGVVVQLEINAIRDELERSLARMDGAGAARRREFVRGHYSWPENALALERLYRGILENRTRRISDRRLQHRCPTS
jgi:glycosyltransferase involved in cell wall biosynthesis